MLLLITTEQLSNTFHGTRYLTVIRGLSQIIFLTVSVIMTLRGGGGGSEGVTLIFYLKHTLTFVIILQPSSTACAKIDVEIFGKISQKLYSRQ